MHIEYSMCRKASRRNFYAALFDVCSTEIQKILARNSAQIADSAVVRGARKIVRAKSNAQRHRRRYKKSRNLHLKREIEYSISCER